MPVLPGPVSRSAGSVAGGVAEVDVGLGVGRPPGSPGRPGRGVVREGQGGPARRVPEGLAGVLEVVDAADAQDHPLSLQAALIDRQRGHPGAPPKARTQPDLSQ